MNENKRVVIHVRVLKCVMWVVIEKAMWGNNKA
jgi:hypothetical protein